MKLYYSALSPFCRKVRMALDYKRIPYEIEDDPKVEDFGHLNPRAEIPALQDGDILVLNSSDIVAYLEYRYPDAPRLLPLEPASRVAARAWERASDTFVDAIVTGLGNFAFADIGKPPPGYKEACRAGMTMVYNDMEKELKDKPFVAGDLSIADLSLYPHLTAAQTMKLRFSDSEHPHVREWLARMTTLDVCKADAVAFMTYWKNLRQSNTVFDKINWGTGRLEWLLANGFHDFFVDEIRKEKVLWSVGPKRNSLKSGFYAGEAAAAPHVREVVGYRMP